MNGELPNGWAITRIEDIAEINPRHDTTIDDRKLVTFVPMPAVSEDVPELDVSKQRPFGEVKQGYTHFGEGDVLFAKITPCMENGKAGVATGLKNGLGCGTTELHVLRPRAGIDSKYIYHFVHQKAFRKEAARNFTGTAGQLRVPVSFMRGADVPLAPRKEQQRIVVALESLLPKVDTSRHRLDNISVILKRFRQAVIAAACSGRLTADWREDDSYENDLPTGWAWTPLKELLPPGGIFDGPFGSNLKSSDYTDSGARVIRLENIGHLRFIGEKETFVSERKYQALRKHTVGEGDIIFSSFIAEEIRACVLPKLSNKAIAKADCFCLRPNPALVDRKYLVFQLVSQKSYNALFEEIHGATRPRVNTTQLRELEIRVCSLPEQREIVRRVDALMKIADRIETRYQEVRSRVDNLTQSILAKAFRGELVAQDPRDEPASVLLARITRQHNGDDVEKEQKRKR